MRYKAPGALPVTLIVSWTDSKYSMHPRLVGI